MSFTGFFSWNTSAVLIITTDNVMSWNKKLNVFCTQYFTGKYLYSTYEGIIVVIIFKGKHKHNITRITKGKFLGARKDDSIDTCRLIIRFTIDSCALSSTLLELMASLFVKQYTTGQPSKINHVRFD